MLVSGGGSGGDPYQIKVNSVSNGGEENSMGYQEIMDKLHGLNPGEMTNAAASFKKLANTLDQVTAKLREQGNQLAENWSGEAASKAMTKFQQLHDQAAQLAAQAHTTSNTMNWMGTEVMPQFKSLPSPQVMGHGEQAAADASAGSVIGPEGTVAGAIYGGFFGADGTAKADKAARSYMQSFNQAMTEANTQLPESTAGPQANTATGGPGAQANTATGGPGAGGSGSGSAYSGVGGTNGAGGTAPSSYTPPSGTGQASLAHLSGGSNGPFNAATPSVPASHVSTPPAGGSLQGYSAPPSGSGGGSPFGNPGAAGGGNANPFSRMAMMPTSGAGDSGAGGEDGGPGEEGMSGEKGLGEDALKATKSGLPGEEGEGLSAEGAAGDAAGAGSTTAAEGAAGADGAAGGAAGADAAGAAGAEGGGAGAMPMAGGGGGQQDKERQRQAWMHEDEEIWGVPGEDIGPVLG